MKRKPTSTFAEAAKAHAQKQADSLSEAVASVRFSIDQAQTYIDDAKAKLAKLANG